MAHIIAIANNKGGIGKTTTAVNLCSLWAHSGIKVALIDNDPQGNCGVYLGVDTQKAKYTLSDVYQGTKSLDDIKIKIDFNEGLKPFGFEYDVKDNFYFIPSKINLEDIQKFDDRKIALLHDAICDIEDNFAMVVIDTGPNLGFLTRSAIIASDMVLIPTEAELFSIEGLKNLVKMITEINKKYEPKLIRSFINNLPSGDEFQKQNASYISEGFGKYMYDVAIPSNKHLVWAKEKGVPVFALEKIKDTSSAGAKAYRALSVRILKDLIKNQEAVETNE